MKVKTEGAVWLIEDGLVTRLSEQPVSGMEDDPPIVRRPGQIEYGPYVGRRMLVVMDGERVRTSTVVEVTP